MLYILFSENLLKTIAAILIYMCANFVSLVSIKLNLVDLQFKEYFTDATEFHPVFYTLLF